MLVPFAVLCGSLAREGRVRAGQRDRVVAVAGPEESANLSRELDGQPERPAMLAWVLGTDDAASERTGDQPLVDVVGAARATVVVLDRSALADQSVVAQAAALHEAGVRVRTLSLFYDQWLGKLPLAELERISLFFDIGELHRARYGRVKRILDTLAACAGLVALVAVTPVVWLGNRLGSAGPLLYRQARVGKGGKEFQILKFRTMRPEQDADASPGSAHGCAGRTSTSSRRWSTSSAGSCPSSAPGPSSPVTWTSCRRSSRSTGSATWFVPVSPAGPR
jgi:hypothetical protein